MPWLSGCGQRTERLEDIVNKHPSFDSRNYGFPRLGMLVRSLDFVDVKSVAGSEGTAQPWVCLRPPSGT